MQKLQASIGVKEKLFLIKNYYQIDFHRKQFSNRGLYQKYEIKTIFNVK